MSKLGIIDYGMGNLLSVRKALEHLGAEPILVDEPSQVMDCDRLILPGVGAFGDAMIGLEERGLVEPIKEYAAAAKPFLGICLGMQILLDSSEEAPGISGLGLIPGKVLKFPSNGLKVPHMGWNRLDQPKPSRLLDGLGGEAYVYFVHSFYVAPTDNTVSAAFSNYGFDFTSAIESGNLAGVQFHPEKSQDAGLQILRNFLSQT